MIKDLVALPFEKWWAERNKPVKKIIDLSPLVDSGIDCEFSDDGEDWGRIGQVVPFLLNDTMPYRRKKGVAGWHYCRPRMNHKMCHDGSKPLEGFVVRVYFDSVDFTVVNTSATLNVYWAHVRAIEYLRVEDGYAYPWEQVSFSYSSGIITQSGTDVDLSGLAGVNGVTTTVLQEHATCEPNDYSKRNNQ